MAVNEDASLTVLGFFMLFIYKTNGHQNAYFSFTELHVSSACSAHSLRKRPKETH